MGFGGPVWHASIAPRRAYYGATMCQRFAELALTGLGDAQLGEWREWSGAAYHLRRRVSVAEQRHVGPVRDIRGTAEARARADALPRRVRELLPPHVVAMELGT